MVYSTKEGSSIPIRIHVACDDESLRSTIAALLAAEPEAFEVIDTSREAEAGAIAIDESQPDVAILAVPLGEDVYRHTRLYQAVADERIALVGFCTRANQADDYRLAGVRTLVHYDDSPESLREAVRAAYDKTRA